MNVRDTIYYTLRNRWTMGLVSTGGWEVITYCSPTVFEPIERAWLPMDIIVALTEETDG